MWIQTLDTPPLPLPCVGAATHPVYHSSEYSAIRSNRLESDTVKPVDFDGVGNAICQRRQNATCKNFLHIR